MGEDKTGLPTSARDTMQEIRRFVATATVVTWTVGTQAEQLAEMSAKIEKLVQSLEDQGWTVKLSTDSQTPSRTRRWTCEPLNGGGTALNFYLVDVDKP